VDEVIAKYVQAMGGQAALANAKTRVLEGTQTTRDLQTTPIKVQEKASGEYRIDIATQPNPTVRVSTAEGAWATGFGPNPAPRELEGVQAGQVARATDFGIGANPKGTYSNLNVRRYDVVDGTPAILVDGRRNDIVSESLYFDRASGLLLRRAIRTRTAYGDLAEQVDYRDYKAVDGVQIPFTVTHTTWNQVTTEKFTGAKVNAPIDDAIFAKQ
jgi:hypothetical protein